MTELRFGTFLAPNVMPVYQAIVDEVGSRLGMTTELVVETDYENCRNDINDICFVCGLPYVMFEREGTSPATPIAAPVLKGERYKGKPVRAAASCRCFGASSRLGCLTGRGKRARVCGPGVRS